MPANPATSDEPLGGKAPTFASKHRLTIAITTVTLLFFGVFTFATITSVVTFSCGPRDGAQSVITGFFEPTLATYKLHNGNYPTTALGLNSLVVAPSGVSTWKGPYLTSTIIPEDPWGNEYHYTYPGLHHGVEKPDIWSDGPDRMNGTADDIVNWH